MSLSDEEIARGKRARILLGNGDITQAFDDVMTDLFNEWTAARDERERESLHAVFRAHQRVQAKLQSWADLLTLHNIE